MLTETDRLRNCRRIRFKTIEGETLTTMHEKLEALERKKERFRFGGGPEQIEKQHKKGRMTARERVEKLLDPGTFQELDLLLTSAEWEFAGPLPSAVIVGYGQIGRRPVFIWSLDATIHEGTLGVVEAKKITQTIEKGVQARVPVIGLIDSEGERISDFKQYPRFYSLDSICKSQVLASGVVPLITLIMGPCKGGMSIFSNLSDFVFMTRKTSYMHVATPPEGMKGEDLGSPDMHAKTTGCCDILTENDEDCLSKCRQLLSYLPSHNQEKPPFVETHDDPNRREEKLLDAVPASENQVFDMWQVISLIVDDGQIFEIQRGWARNLIIGFVRLGGQVAGIVASNPRFKGGCMNLDAADKMAAFVRFCDAFQVPLIWLADCPAFVPAVDEEVRGLIRHGSKAVFANSMATVPQITVIIRKLYGGGGLVFPGIRMGGDLSGAWPIISRGLMGPEGAVAILYRRELEGIEDPAKKEEQKQKRIEEIKGKMDLAQAETTQFIIDPRETRPFLINALKMLANKRRENPPRKHDNIRL
jgi:acetyl-CoA carboxylase carboxyltransferase component